MITNQYLWHTDNLGVDSKVVDSDFQLFKRDHYLKEGGHKIFQHHE